MRKDNSETVENILAAIDKLERIDTSDEYAYERALLAYASIKKIPVLIHFIEAGTPVFRTRTHEEGDKEVFESLTDIFSPPSSFVKRFARCNRPFQSVFYCSENRPTSYSELVDYWADSRKYGEKLLVTIGRWVLKRPLSTVAVTTPDKDKRISDFDKSHGQYLDHFLSDYEGDFLEANIIFYRYLTEKFRMPAKNDLKTYIITTAYCNYALMHAAGQSEAIYYPSVPFGGKGVNFALNSTYSSFNNLVLTHVIRDEFTIERNENGRHSFVQTGNIVAKEIDVSNNKIIW